MQFSLQSQTIDGKFHVSIDNGIKVRLLNPSQVLKANEESLWYGIFDDGGGAIQKVLGERLKLKDIKPLAVNPKAEALITQYQQARHQRKFCFIFDWTRQNDKRSDQLNRLRSADDDQALKETMQAIVEEIDNEKMNFSKSKLKQVLKDKLETLEQNQDQQGYSPSSS